MDYNQDQPFGPTVNALASYGWYHIGDWMFVRNGLVYDLSAADTSPDALDRIESNGRFVVGTVLIG